MSEKGFFKKLLGSLITKKPKKTISQNKETQVNQRSSKRCIKKQDNNQAKVKSDQLESDFPQNKNINQLIINKEKNDVLGSELKKKAIEIKNEEKSLIIEQKTKYILNLDKYSVVTIFRDVTLNFFLNNSSKKIKNEVPIINNQQMVHKNISNRPKPCQSKRSNSDYKYKSGSNYESHTNSNNYEVNGQKHETENKIKIFKDKDEKVLHELVYKLKLSRSLNCKESNIISFKHVVNAKEEKKKFKYQISILQVRPKKVTYKFIS
jgi:hypothetical protein